MTTARADPLDALGRFALRFVKPGYSVGLGTGRAASAFIRALGESGIKVRGVPTSRASAELAHQYGIELTTLGDAKRLDVDLDGADEVDPRLNLIKGYGGAMVREKVVAAASKRFIVLVGPEKLVARLGARKRLPVEVVPFARDFVANRVRTLGLKAQVRTLESGGEFITDNGNLVLDLTVAEIRNPERLERDLLAIPGVVGTGLFVKMASMIVVAGEDGKPPRTIKPR